MKLQKKDGKELPLSDVGGKIIKMIDLEDIFDKHEIELDWKFVEFEHKINKMFDDHIVNIKRNII